MEDAMPARQYKDFFQKYVKAYNRGLKGDLDTELIQSFFTEHFLAAGPDSVETGSNNITFSATLRKAYSFYQKIGTREMHVRNLMVTPIDRFHDMVKVYYRADYTPQGKPIKSIDFDVTYFIQISDQGPKIFGFVVRDEMQAYRDAGLVS
ncbi:nuclear transport factor 2 family protein [Bdellovibrio sp. ZAP7]|uniref:nuclear transport factor 2 family protein n=1 Tax=Bdellovibrio sp. ZAP7 TaxID=2231053 RepID=UPI0011573D1B|nr:nuclear transport factor 2 family protein [Bdellovibrio sp. ZAP7]